MKITARHLLLLFLIIFSSYASANAESDFAVKAIELGEQNLFRIGITHFNGRYEMAAYKMAGPKSAEPVRFILGNNLISRVNAKTPDTTLTPRMLPWLIVTASGNNSAAYFNDPQDYWKTQGVSFTEKTFSGNINNWTLYHIAARDANDDPFDIYLWYDSDPLANTSIDSSKMAEASAETENRSLTNSQNPAVSSLNVYPNPLTNGSGRFTFELAEQRSVNIAVYDVNGKNVSSIAGGQSHDAGEAEYALNLNSLTAGMYILAITTDHNESLASRFIIIKN